VKREKPVSVTANTFPEEAQPERKVLSAGRSSRGGNRRSRPKRGKKKGKKKKTIRGVVRQEEKKK